MALKATDRDESLEKSIVAWGHFAIQLHIYSESVAVQTRRVVHVYNTKLVRKDVTSNALANITRPDGRVALGGRGGVEMIGARGAVQAIQGHASAAGVGINVACDALGGITQTDSRGAFCGAGRVKVVGGRGAVETVEGNCSLRPVGEDVAGNTLPAVSEAGGGLSLGSAEGVKVVYGGAVVEAVKGPSVGRVAAVARGQRLAGLQRGEHKQRQTPANKPRARRA